MSNFISDTALFAYSEAYIKSPIFLRNGIATQILTGSTLNNILRGTPSLIKDAASNFIRGIPGGGSALDNPGELPVPLAALFIPLGLIGMDWAFAPEPGAEMYRSEISYYAAYDATQAANNTTREPLRFDFVLELPPNTILGMTMQLPVMETLKAMLFNHRNLGGVFDCLMPVGFYRNCILTDVKTTQSQTDTRHLQPALMLSFQQPVITTEELENVYNQVMKRLGGSVGVPT